VPAEFFAVVIGQRLDPGFKRFERLADRRATKSAVFFEIFAMTAYPLLRATTAIMACLWLAPITV
jgi:hypothetical protein